MDDVLTAAIAALETQTGVFVDREKQLAKHGESGNPVQLRINNQISAERFNVLSKTYLNNSSISQISMRSRDGSDRLILVTKYVSPPQAEKLRELDVPFFDTAGNAYLKTPNLYVFVTGRKATAERTSAVGIFNPRGIKVIFSLLTKRGLENEDYRTIAAETDVPKSTVAMIMNDLARQRFLARRGKNGRELQNRGELIKRWTEAYAEKFRMKLEPVRFHSTRLTGRWWEEINPRDYDAVWGGETGGKLLTKHLRPETATLYADSNLPRLQLKFGLIRDKRGEFEILKRFWKPGENDDIAPPLIVYADLMATADERNIETARMVYDEYIAPLAEDS